MDEREEYAAIMRREVTRYESLPLWRVLARTRRMAAVRRAAADLAYAGCNPKIPKTARVKFLHALRHWWKSFALRFHIKTLVTIAAAVAALSGFIAWGLSLGGPPKPLAPGITQRGFTFIVPPGYIQRANYADAEPGALCDRIPAYGSYDDYKMTTRQDGAIVIVCDPNSSS